jgi:hypothetical protein
LSPIWFAIVPLGTEKCRFLAEQLGDPLLQAVDRRVFAILVVADRCGGHCPPHIGRREGDRIRTKVDALHQVTPTSSHASRVVPHAAVSSLIRGRHSGAVIAQCTR